MFEQLISERMRMNTRTTELDDDCISSSMRPVQFRPSFIDRVLPALGDALINAGLKLKYRPHTSLNTEPASTPNYLIML